jgi:hypothetical protein
MKIFISIFFIFLCIVAEAAEHNTFLCNEESVRVEERAGEIQFEETLTPYFKVRNSLRREPAGSRPLISSDHSSVKGITEAKNEIVKIQYQLHAHTQQTSPVYLVKKVFLI